MSGEILAVVTDKRALTPSISRFELARADGKPLPDLQPGDHITIHTPAGYARSYSLTDQTATGAYAISVLREPHSRGGSTSMHDDVDVGAVLAVDGPRNAFPLVEAAAYLFIAGGIGITAIRAMFTNVRSRGAPVRLLYLTRTAEESAYLDELIAHGPDSVHVHHSETAGRVDLWPELGTPDDVTHIYCCASPRLMAEVRALTMHWRPSQIHFENFAGVTGTSSSNLPFRAVWEPTGHAVDVAADTTLLDALNGAGADIANSCRSGTCGTCILRLVSGDAKHHDLVLTPAQQPSRIMACVSRAAGDLITVGPVPDEPR